MKKEEAGELAVPGFEGMLGNMDAFKDLDPNDLQQMMMEGLKDPAVQEMVREIFIPQFHARMDKIHPRLIFCLSHLRLNPPILYLNELYSLVECKGQWMNL